MKNFKLNQKLLVNSSCYFRGEIFKFEKTRLADASKTEDGYRVRMTSGHWGACPTRDKSEVVAFESDIDRIVERFFTAKLEESTLEIGQGKGKSLIIVEDENYGNDGRGHIVVRYIKYKSTEETMREGKYDKYYISQFAGSCTLKIRDGVMPYGVFDNIKQAEEKLREFLKRNV